MVEHSLSTTYHSSSPWFFCLHSSALTWRAQLSHHSLVAIAGATVHRVTKRKRGVLITNRSQSLRHEVESASAVVTRLVISIGSVAVLGLACPR